MAAWPELDELKQVLDVTSDDWDGEPLSGGDEDNQTGLTRLLATAIAAIKAYVGNWDEDVDEPDDNLSQAALRLAELLALKPELAATVVGGRGVRMTSFAAADPTLSTLLYGRRRSFGIA